VYAVGVWSWDAQGTPTGTMTVKNDPDGPVLHMCGDVDAPVVQQYEDESSVDRATIVAVDVSEMAYIDSTGLSFLVRWAKDQSSVGRPAVIRNATPRFEQVLYIAGISSLFARED
jgi:anti-anti-sigma factor